MHVCRTVGCYASWLITGTVVRDVRFCEERVAEVGSELVVDGGDGWMRRRRVGWVSGTGALRDEASRGGCEVAPEERWTVRGWVMVLDSRVVGMVWSKRPADEARDGCLASNSRAISVNI